MILYILTFFLVVTAILLWYNLIKEIDNIIEELKRRK